MPTASNVSLALFSPNDSYGNEPSKAVALMRQGLEKRPPQTQALETAQLVSMGDYPWD